LINVQPEENCRIDALLCCSDVEVLVGKAVENVQVLVAEKKSAWTDLDRVSFKKNFKESNVEIEKSAWTDLGKVKKKASSAASVFKNFFTTGHLGVAEAFCTSMA
jgi:hypothetical protein